MQVLPVPTQTLHTIKEEEQKALTRGHFWLVETGYHRSMYPANDTLNTRTTRLPLSKKLSTISTENN